MGVTRRRLDVLFNPGFTAPVWFGCPMVTVFHDLQHKRHPEYFRWHELPFWRVFLFVAAHRSQRLLAVSESTAADLQDVYRLPAEDIVVIHHGVDPKFFCLRRAPAARPYVLCVSTLHPHKNLDGLLHAFANFHQERPEYRLVMAGMRGFHTEELERVRESLGLGEAVEFTGWIPRERLYELFAAARAFLYPSTFEGFGMPVLEAMAAGLPTGCSRLEPMASLAAQGAWLFDPADTAGMAEAMRRLTGDEELRVRLSAAGPARAAQFSWETAAKETLEVLRSVVEEGPHA